MWRPNGPSAPQRRTGRQSRRTLLSPPSAPLRCAPSPERSARRYGFDPAGRTPPETAESLASTLRRLFPAAAGARIEQSWSGVQAVPRDWCAGVSYNRTPGFGWAGGYVGQGVATAKLDGRTL